MLRDITIGQYYPTGSVIHRMDPRVKLFGTLVFLISVFAYKGIVGFAIVTLFLAALMAFLVYSTLTGPKKAIARWEENMRRSFGTTQLHLCTEFYDRALAQTVAEDDSLVTEGYSAISQMKETEHLILLRHSASQWFFLAKDGFQGGAAELEKFGTFIAQKIGG